MIKRIPYGKADFEAVNALNEYYVDKTMFIPEIERTPFIFLVRPRRFGKSLFLSMLHSYYDLNKADRFEELFHDTWILENPTAERSKYMILTFNFSGIDSRGENLEDSFNHYCNGRINKFLETYKMHLLPNTVNAVNSREVAYEKLAALASEQQGAETKIYIMIDEYDNFANTILSEERTQDYHHLTHSSGIFKLFFSTLKEATSDSGSCLARLFITGVSPITMDDVTSGFNIGSNISLNTNINQAFGFTRKEVETMVDYYSKAGQIPVDKDLVLEVMEKWYGHYQFSRNNGEKVYNSCSVLHLLNVVSANKEMPDDYIDTNLRMDYQKLKNLVIIDKKLNGNFSMLREILNSGGITTNINQSFPFEKITSTENFISLLYFLGLVTHAGQEKGRAYLAIPNETVRSLLYGYIRSSLESVGSFAVDVYKLSTLMSNMAYEGEFKPVFKFLAEEINKQTKVRDYIEGEKVIQGFFLAYLNIVDFYLGCSEEELNKGYADIVLKPQSQKYQDMKVAYLIEFKYISRVKDHESTKGQKVLLTKIAEKVKESEHQLAKYANDETAQKTMHTEPYGHIELKKVIVIFHGWDLVYLEEHHGGK